MGYVSMGAYDATVRIPEFKGLMQYGDGIGTAPVYAVEAKNALTAGGGLRPMAKCTLLAPEAPGPIVTLARLHRRWLTSGDDHDVLIASSGGKLYYWIPTGETETWTEIAMPSGFTGEGYQSDAWSYVTYEVNPEGAAAPVDVMLLSNAKDGMICVYGNDMTAAMVSTPKKFGVIARYAERIWGGAIENDPDMLVYSAPFDPFDWAQNDEIPEDGAGDVQQPSWDGDSFTALTPFGGQLIAFKRTKIWRVMGTNPGEYVFKEQYGGGTAYPRTVAVDVARILMLGNDGMMQYDGESASAFYRDMARKVYERMNPAAMSKAFACMFKGAYYCALPLDGSVTNNAVLRYDTVENTFLLREGVAVEAFLPTETALYFTSASTPGRIWQWGEKATDAECEPLRWVTPWVDCGYKNVVKGSFAVYLTVECAEDVELTLSIQTEKKAKAKTLTFSPPAAGRMPKQRRVMFGGNGRRFRLVVESEGTAYWKLLGGVQIEVETDTD